MQYINSEYLDKQLVNRINAIERDAAKGPASVFGMDIEEAIQIQRVLVEEFAEELFNQEDAIIPSTERLQAKRHALISALKNEDKDAIMKSYLDYVREMHIVKEERWERFSSIASTIPIANVRNWTLLCELLEIEFCASYAFDMAKLNPFASGCADSIYRLNQEFLELIRGQGEEFFEKVVQRLEDLYRLDLKTDVAVSGVAWIEPINDIYRRLQDGPSTQSILLVENTEFHLPLVRRLWGNEFFIFDCKNSTHIRELLKHPASFVDRRVFLEHFDELDWADQRSIHDLKKFESSLHTCSLIGSVSDRKTIDNMDPGTFSRYYPIWLENLTTAKERILTGLPSNEEIDNLRETFSKGRFGGYTDLLINAVLHAFTENI